MRFEYSLISVLGLGMHQNMAKGQGSVNIIAFRVIGSLLHLLMPKRDGNHEISHGQCYSSYIHPSWLGNGSGSAQ